MKFFNKQKTKKLTKEEVIEQINNLELEIANYENDINESKLAFDNIKHKSNQHIDELKTKNVEIEQRTSGTKLTLENEIKSLEAKLLKCNEKLQSLIEEQTLEYSKEVKNKKTLTEELAKNKSRENSEIINSLKNQMDDLISKQSEEIEFLSEAYDLNIHNLQKTYEDQKNHLDNAVAILEMKYNEIFKNGEHEVIEETKSQMQITQKLNEVKDKYRLIESNKDNTIKQLIEEYHQNYEEILKHNTEEIKQMQDLMNKDIEELKITLAKLKDNKNAMLMNYEKEMASLNAQKEQFSYDYDQQVNELVSHQNEMLSEENSLKAKLDGLKLEIAEKEKKISDLKIEHKNKLHELNDEHQANLVNLRENYKTQNEDLEHSLKQDLKNKKAELANKRQALIEDKEKQIVDYKSEINLLEEEYDLKLKALEDKIATYEEQNHEKINVLKEYTLKLNKDLHDLDLLHTNKMHEYEMVLEDEKRKWDGVIKDARQKYDNDVEDIKAAFNSNVASLNREIKEYEVEIENIQNQTSELQKQHVFDLDLSQKQLIKTKELYESKCQEINDRILKVDEEIKDYEQQNNGIIANLKEINAQNKEEIAKINDEHNLKAEALAIEHQANLDQLEKEHQQKVQALSNEAKVLEEQFKDELRSLELKFVSDKQTIEDNYEEKLASFEEQKIELDNKFKAYNEESKVEASRIEAQMSALSLALENEENTHREALDALNLEKQNQLDELKLDYEKEVELLKQSEEETLVKLKEEYEKLIVTKNDKNQALDNLNNQFEKDVAELKLTYTFDDSQLLELEDKLANRQKELNVFKNEKELLIQNRLTAKEQLHNELNLKADELSHKLDSAKEEASELLKAKEAEYQQEEDKITSANRSYELELSNKLEEAKSQYELDLDNLRKANEEKLKEANEEFEAAKAVLDQEYQTLLDSKEERLEALKNHEESNDEKIIALRNSFENAKNDSIKEYEANKERFNDSITKIKEDIHSRISQTQSINDGLRNDIKLADIEFKTIEKENSSKLASFKNQFETRQKELDQMLEEYELRFRDIEREKAYLTAEYELKVGMIEKDIHALNKQMADIEFENSESIDSIYKDLKYNLGKKATAFDKIKNVLAKNKEEIIKRYQNEEETLSQVYKNRFDQVKFALDEALFELENSKAFIMEEHKSEVDKFNSQIIKEALAFDLENDNKKYDELLETNRANLLAKQDQALQILKEEEASLSQKADKIKDSVKLLNEDYQKALDLTINSMHKLVDDYKLKLDRYTYNDKQMSDVTVEVKEEEKTVDFKEEKPAVEQKKSFGLFRRKN